MSDFSGRPSGGPTSSACVTYSVPSEIRKKLLELKVPEEILIQALQRGVAEKLTAEIYDPSTAAGCDLYKFATRHVRKELHIRGWELKDSNNIAIIFDPLVGTTIIVCAGNRQTGMVIGEQPRTKRPKGPIFLDVTEVIQKDLFGHDVVEKRSFAVTESKVWLLLHYHDGVGPFQVLRAELSRPVEAVDGLITKWSERIMLNVPLPGAMADDFSAGDNGPVIIPNVASRL
jgi:hypothetical protein